MLRVADGFGEEGVDDPFVPAASHAPAAPVMRGATPAPVGAPDRYGSSRRPNIPVILLIILIHAVAIAALIQVRQHVQRVREAHLSVVNLTPPPPPPQQAAAPPSPAKPHVVAPPPLVQVPAPTPPAIATTPDIAPPAPAAPATAVVAPPAPPVMANVASIVQGGDLGPRMVSGKPPRYPIESRRKREQGTVVLSLTLGLDGAVESVTIAQSSGFARLDNAAREAVRHWRWNPIIRDGQPVRVKGVVEIPFVLRSASE